MALIYVSDCQEDKYKPALIVEMKRSAGVQKCFRFGGMSACCNNLMDGCI